jgi:hypothetical protein
MAMHDVFDHDWTSAQNFVIVLTFGAEDLRLGFLLGGVLHRVRMESQLFVG